MIKFIVSLYLILFHQKAQKIRFLKNLKFKLNQYEVE